MKLMVQILEERQTQMEALGVNQQELQLAESFETYGEFCDRMGIVDPERVARADILDGYKGAA